ncbi:hypothetical protein CR51_11435 [Caballeronia megalochromosomata]|nr:hypothetical protein CR51_11435 [Caballeronia megalochromosomata]
MKHAQAQEVVLARMALSRAELLDAHIAEEPLRIARVPRPVPATRPAPWFLRTPNAELIALALVGIAILGVRRTVQTAVGAGLSASTHRAIGDVLNALRG